MATGYEYAAHRRPTPDDEIMKWLEQHFDENTARANFQVLKQYRAESLAARTKIKKIKRRRRKNDDARSRTTSFASARARRRVRCFSETKCDLLTLTERTSKKELYP